MFVIFGTGPKEKIEAKGKFVCPNCNVLKNYLVKSSRQFFRLFFIPIIPTGDKTDPGVECQTCNKFYDTNVLEDNNYYLDGTPFIKGEHNQQGSNSNNLTIIKTCPNCKTNLRLPRGKTGTVKCTNCQQKIYTSTWKNYLYISFWFCHNLRWTRPL